MFLEFFNLRQQPFGVTPDPAYLFPSRTHCEALDALTEGILEGRGFLALIAEPGMGKTTLLYQVLDGMREKARGAYLFQTQCDSREFFQYLLGELGIDSTGLGLVAMHNKLNELLFEEMLAGKRFVLIVDEAQNLEDSVLETIRLLSNFETSNTKLLQIILAGQPQLAEKLAQPNHSQLLQRITVVQRLEAFSPDESAAYIRHRVKIGGNTEEEIFEQDALALIAAQSGGVPRNINRICYNALLEAHAQGAHRVSPEIVEAANRKFERLGRVKPELVPTPAPGPTAANAAQAAAAGAPAPTALTYQPLSGLRPRSRNPWTGGLVALLLAICALIPLSLHGRLSSAFGALTIYRSLRTASASAAPALHTLAPWHDGDAGNGDPLALLQANPRGTPIVASIQAQSGKNDGRVVVLLDRAVQFESARITSPDRIYFDLQHARLGPAVAERITPADSDSGLLKWVRAAQNTDDVVRLVLDAGGAKYYSAQLLRDPYRLVIDVYAQAVASMNVGASSTLPTGALDEPSVARAAEPPGSGSLARELGLKINRIAIDPGHGGSDTGAMGPHGLLEKDLCLDVALRLGRLIEQNLPGAEVIYTRKDDTFVPLERRTDIANSANADLFISIHANSSDLRYVRGVETYYLNLSSSPEAMKLATRENALSLASLHDLPDLLQKIARNEKTQESRQLAGEIQDALSSRLQLVSRNETNRGVKQAPFIVLTGAKMPAILSEISFVSNARDESLLLGSDQRQRVAEGLYRGIAAYLERMNSAPNRTAKLVSENRQRGAGAINAAKTP